MNSGVSVTTNSVPIDRNVAQRTLNRLKNERPARLPVKKPSEELVRLNSV